MKGRYEDLLSKFFCLPSSSSVFSSWHEWSWGKMNTIKKHKLSFMLEAWICEVVLRLLFLAIAKELFRRSAQWVRGYQFDQVLFLSVYTHKGQSPFYSAPSIFAVLRNLVWEIWFEKSGSRNLVDQKKRWFCTIDLDFFRLEKIGWPEKKIRVFRTTFLEPLFYTFPEMRSQNKRSTILEPNFSNKISQTRFLKPDF